MEISQRPNQTLALEVTDESQVGQIRRRATLLAGHAGFDAKRTGNIAIIASEAARNIARHARQGSVLLNLQTLGEARSLDVVALDRGPGMADVQACLADGFSTVGTAGTGLGAIRRLADEFDIWSRPGRGTVLLARSFQTRQADPLAAWLEIGGLTVPLAGYLESGDVWACRHDRQRLSVMVGDGLGHGREAAAAADLALEFFSGSNLGPDQLIQSLDPNLRQSRGAAVAVCEFPLGSDRFAYAEVGNVSATLISAQQRSGLLGQHGIVGGNIREVRLMQYAWRPASLLLLASDGMNTRWQLESDLFRSHPMLIAGLLYRDFRRANDDVTIVVIRRRR